MLGCRLLADKAVRDRASNTIIATDQIVDVVKSLALLIRGCGIGLNNLKYAGEAASLGFSGLSRYELAARVGQLPRQRDVKFLLVHLNPGSWRREVSLCADDECWRPVDEGADAMLCHLRSCRTRGKHRPDRGQQVAKSLNRARSERHIIGQSDEMELILGILRLSVFCKRKPEADSVHYAASELFVCIRFGSFQFGRTKWHV